MTENTRHEMLYPQLREILRAKIEEGFWTPGQIIPTEEELAKQFHTDLSTVHNAIEALIYEGRMRRIPNQGISILGAKMDRDLDNLCGFTQTMLEKNALPSTKVLNKIMRPAGEKYAAIFGIDPDDPIYYIKRVCYASGEPVSMEEIFIPHYIVPKLEGMDLSVFSLSEVYHFYGVHPVRARQTLDLAVLESSGARLLQIPPEQAVLLFECTSYNAEDRVVEFSRNYTRGDKYNFTVHFEK